MYNDINYLINPDQKKKEDQKERSLRRKKIQVREKVGKSRNIVFFPMICCSGG